MKKLHKILFPQHKRHWGRLIVLALVTFVTLKYLALPIKAVGKSMENTVMDGKWYLAVRIPFLFNDDQLDYGDITLVKFHGSSIYLLKRVIGKEGDKIAFKDGDLFRNGQKVEENYVKGPCNWNLEERVVKAANLYVVGDNRSMDINQHKFGQVSKRKVKGVVLW